MARPTLSFRACPERSRGAKRGICFFFFLFSLASLGCKANQPAQSDAQAATPVSPAESAPPPGATGGFDGARAFAHVEQLVAIGPRPAGSDGIRSAQDYIRSRLRSYNCSVEEHDFQPTTPAGPLPMKNLVVKIPGASPGVVLLSSHYDTKRMPGFVGANDGGSSTGLMLELARVLCTRKSALTVWIVFFDGEEAIGEWSPTDGTYGSRELAARLALAGELDRIRAMLVADLIGDRNLRIKREVNSTAWLTDLVWDAAARLGYQHIFVADTTSVEDDHIPFLRRKVPAVDVIHLDGVSYWHTGGDTLDKISPRSLAIVGHVFLESLATLEKKLGR